MTLGQSIQKYRKQLGMSQEQLAENIHVSRQTISKWESDISLPDINKLIELSKIFQITLNELLMIDDKDNYVDIQQLQSVVEQLLLMNENHEKKEKRKNIAILLCVVFCLILTAFATAKVKNMFDNLNESIADTKNHVDTQITNLTSSLTNSFQEQIENENSLLSQFDYQLRDAGNYHLTFHADLLLKNYQEGIDVKLVLKMADQDRELQLVEQNYHFVGDIQIPIRTIEKIEIFITYQGKTETQILYGDWNFDNSIIRDATYGYSTEKFDFDKNKGQVIFSIICYQNDIYIYSGKNDQYFYVKSKNKLHKGKIDVCLNLQEYSTIDLKYQCDKETKIDQLVGIIDIQDIHNNDVLSITGYYEDLYGNKEEFNVNYRYNKQYAYQEFIEIK